MKQTSTHGVLAGRWLCRRTGSTRPGPAWPTESGPWEWVPTPGVGGGHGETFSQDTLAPGKDEQR